MNKVPIVVHEAAISNQSPALSRLMCGEMSESLAGEVILKDVDEETFARFAQFAYLGDYSVPTMIISPSKKCSTPPNEWPAQSNEWPAQPEGPLALKRDEFPWRIPEVPGKKKSKSPGLRYARLNPKFSSLYYKIDPQTDFTKKYKPSLADGEKENVSKILLVHASLYVLGDKWGVEELRMLALSKLHKTLSMLPRDVEKIPYIVDLTRYAYSDENTPDLESGMDNMRELICCYLATCAEMSSRSISFLTLLEEGGPFVRDFWKIVGPMIH